MGIYSLAVDPNTGTFMNIMINEIISGVKGGLPGHSWTKAAVGYFPCHCLFKYH